MNITIIPIDRTVSIDGLTFNGIDLSFIPSNQHAIQWYNNVGEVEIKDDNGRIVENQKIETFDFYQPAIDSWNIKKQEYEESLIPVPVPDTPETIKAVTMRQARLALLQTGYLASVEAAIDSLSSPQKEAARIEWEYSQEVQRHNGFVAIIGPSLGLTEQQIDDLFFLAATL